LLYVVAIVFFIQLPNFSFILSGNVGLPYFICYT